jgi:hypothetical protein
MRSRYFLDMKKSGLSEYMTEFPLHRCCVATLPSTFATMGLQPPLQISLLTSYESLNSNPNTVGKLRLSAFSMCIISFVGVDVVR